MRSGKISSPDSAGERKQATPLLDHIHPPLSTERHWEAFHASRADEIMDLENSYARTRQKTML